jgi:hypothetical protein
MVGDDACLSIFVQCTNCRTDPRSAKQSHPGETRCHTFRATGSPSWLTSWIVRSMVSGHRERVDLEVQPPERKVRARSLEGAWRGRGENMADGKVFTGKTRQGAGLVVSTGILGDFVLPDGASIRATPRRSATSPPRPRIGHATRLPLRLAAVRRLVRSPRPAGAERRSPAGRHVYSDRLKIRKTE